jgi:hypothetical protein
LISGCLLIICFIIGQAVRCEDKILATCKTRQHADSDGIVHYLLKLGILWPYVLPGSHQREDQSFLYKSVTRARILRRNLFGKTKGIPTHTNWSRKIENLHIICVCTACMHIRVPQSFNTGREMTRCQPNDRFSVHTDAI